MQYRFLKTMSVERKTYKSGAIVDGSELLAGNVEVMLRLHQIEVFVEPEELEGSEITLPRNFAFEDEEEGGNKPDEAPKPKAKAKPSKKAKGKAPAKVEAKSEETEPTPEDAEPSSSADPAESAEPGGTAEPGEPSNQ